MNNLPDLSRSAALLAISVELEGCKQNIFGEAIRAGLRTNSLRQVCHMIMDQVRDGHRTMVESCIGSETLNKIEKLFS